MPRRKKNSTVERKPSLVFTESPVNIQKNMLSPVLCARHPPTASSIPIENLNNLSWVSPQFRHITSSGGHRKLRNTRQRRHSVASHRNLLNSHGLNKENHSLSNHTTKLKKFNSLKFVGERTCTSIVEDVEITVETDAASDEENVAENRISLVVSPNRGTTHANYGHCDESDTDDNQINNISLGEDLETCENADVNGIHPLKLKAPIKRLFASQLKINPDISSKTSSDKLTTSNKVVHNISAQIQSQTVSESEEESPVLLRRSARIKHLHSLLNISDSPFRSIGGHRTVLAPDTPENEYGWSKRQRQLSKYIKKTS